MKPQDFVSAPLAARALLERLGQGNVICVVQCVKSVLPEFSTLVDAAPSGSVLRSAWWRLNQYPRSSILMLSGSASVTLEDRSAKGVPPDPNVYKLLLGRGFLKLFELTDTVSRQWHFVPYGSRRFQTMVFEFTTELSAWFERRAQEMLH